MKTNIQEIKTPPPTVRHGNIRNEIVNAYSYYIAKHNKAPTYAQCEILFEGGKTPEEVIIATTLEISKEDESIFLYCESLNNLLSLTEESTEDFRIINFRNFE